MNSRTRRSLSALTIGALVCAPLVFAGPAQAADSVDITIVDINDFHGRIDSNTTKFATTVEQIRQAAGEANTLFVSVGDNIGASPFASATQQDTPTIDVLNALDLDVSAVGNHEFDRGMADLTGRVSDRADYDYLGANVMNADDTPALPASETFEVSGLTVAVIGAVTEETPTLVSPGGITGLKFTDPVEAVNDEVARLKALPDAPDVYLAAYHEGAGAGTPDGASFEQEIAAGGAFAHLVNDTDPAVSAIMTGHTHKVYAWDAPIPGTSATRPVIQTGSYGENVGKTVLSVDPDTGKVTSHTVANVGRVAAADMSFPRVAAINTIVTDALAYATTIGNQPVGSVSADITRAFSGGSYVGGKYAGGSTDDRASESTLGNLVPDAMLAQSKGTQAPADLALNNPGGLRNSELFYAGNTASNPANADGVVTYAEANTILPFTNNLYTVTLTGTQLKKVFEQQWQRDGAGAIPSRPYLQLGMSKNVRYTFDASQAEGSRVTSLWVDDAEVVPTQTYKVIAPSFLALGGDNFRAFAEGSWADTGVVDYEGWIDYLGKNPGLSPDFGRRAVAVTGLSGNLKVGAATEFSLPKLNLTSLGSPQNTTATATLSYGDQVLDLGSQAVTGVAGASGTFTVTPPVGAVGDAVIRVTAAPSGTVATIPVSIGKADSTVTATAPEQVTKGETFDVGVAIDSVDDADLSGEVTVTDGSTTLGTATSVDGGATVEVNASDLRLGQRTLTVTYGGSSEVAESTTTVPVEVIKGETEFTATGSSTAYGMNPTITLTADSGTTGVVFVANALGMNVGTAFLIDGKGTFTFGGTSLKPGTHAFTVFFNGSSAFEPTATTATLTVTKAATATKASVPKKIKVNQQRANLVAKVSAKGFTVQGGTVTVKRGSKVLGRATVKNGVAKVRLPKLAAKGKVTFSVSYAGSAVANPSSTTVKTTVVKK